MRVHEGICTTGRICLDPCMSNHIASTKFAETAVNKHLRLVTEMDDNGLVLKTITLCEPVVSEAMADLVMSPGKSFWGMSLASQAQQSNTSTTSENWSGQLQMKYSLQDAAKDSETAGRLHPLGILIDYVKDMASFVVIFNKRLMPTKAPSANFHLTTPDNNTEETTDEATEWPWRYTKSCVQVADWHEHLLGVHLSLTHLVEEAVIVAANRSFDNLRHPVFQILQPHWLKTLSVNDAAREILVPAVINLICGLKYIPKSNVQLPLSPQLPPIVDYTGKFVP
ncbi:lipoxygenase [Peziza echinospora]|nr:lipoxygenase [Peziza echinospora]